MPFFIICLTSDILSIRSSPITGSVSAVCAFLLAILLFVIMAKYVLSEFILRVDPVNPHLYTYGCMARMVVNACLFVVGDATFYKGWLVLSVLVNIGQLCIQSSK